MGLRSFFEELSKEKEKNMRFYYVYAPTVYELDDSIDYMIKEYCKKDKLEASKMRSVVERIAYWYELIHDDTDISRIFGEETSEDVSVDRVLFDGNDSLRGRFGFKELIETIPYDKGGSYFKNNSLYHLDIPFDYKNGLVEIDFNMNGEITSTKNLSVLASSFGFEEEGFNPKDINVLVSLIKDCNCFDNPDIVAEINCFDFNRQLQKDILTMAMKKIIINGGKEGVRRAYLFANEFGLDKDLPIRFSLVSDDDTTIRLLDRYLEDGGRRDLSLIVGGYPHRHVRDTDEFITVSEYLAKKKGISKSIGKRD